MISLPGARIPEWFDHCDKGGSISFWFRNKFPAVALCTVMGLGNILHFDVKIDPEFIINGNKRFCAPRCGWLCEEVLSRIRTYNCL